jgi:hypothetical protein
MLDIHLDSLHNINQLFKQKLKDLELEKVLAQYK